MHEGVTQLIIFTPFCKCSEVTHVAYFAVFHICRTIFERSGKPLWTYFIYYICKMSHQSRLKDTFGSASPNMKSENDWVTMIIEWLLHFRRK